MTTGRRFTAVLVTVVVAVATAGALAAPGDDLAGVGDPFFPNGGNRGYDVLRYDLDITYAPKANRLRGVAKIDARSKMRLTRFHLDLRRLKVRSVRVNGVSASRTRRGQELIITPSDPIGRGKRFLVRISYGGHPKPVVDPDGSREGWIKTPDGAFVVGEPQGSPSWFPCNDHPSDKAAFFFRITAPKGLHAVANGRLLSVRRTGGVRTWTWTQALPMATYLSTVNIGRGSVQSGRAGGVPFWNTVDPREARKSRPVLRKLGSVMNFLAQRFGPYPFDSTGAIVDRAGVGYALETQTRPIYDGAPDIYILVHETAHQWYGNSVTLRTWPQIWLNEGFATWAEWLWSERHGGKSAAMIFRELLAVPASEHALWDPPPGSPGEPANLFHESIYLRGAMALQALREKVGDPAFFSTLRRWATENRYGSGTIREFIALAETRSGRQLDRLFRVWLYQPGKPRWDPAGRVIRDGADERIHLAAASRTQR